MLIRLIAVLVAVQMGLVAQSSSLEQRVRALEDKETILKAMNRYAYLVDFGTDIHEYTDLYTDDAVFLSVPPPPGKSAEAPASRDAGAAMKGAVVGRQGLEKWITNEWAMRDRLLATGHYRIHAWVEPDIILNGDHASVRSYFLTTDNDNGRIYMVSIGVYQDEFVRSRDGHWLIRERYLLRQGGTGGGAPGGPAARKEKE